MPKLVLLLLVIIVVLSHVGFSHTRLTASIRSDPSSPPYLAATWISLACDVENATGSVYYNWTLLRCNYQSNPRVTFSANDRSDPGDFSLRVKSTSSICEGTIVCTANDTAGNTARATWQVESVTGIGLWGLPGPIQNNSAYRANTDGRIGTIYCHSASYDDNIGRWISPDGVDITQNLLDSFSVTFNNGPHNPSYNRFQLFSPSSIPFTTSDEGVYSCVMPDENGDLQTVNLGIYTHTYSSGLSMSNVGRISESPLTLVCATSGLPPTVVEWSKSRTDISNSSIYKMSQVITNRRNSSYDNLLTINLPPEAASGLYECNIESIRHDYQDDSGIVSSSVIQYIGVYVVGSNGGVRCTLTNVDTITYEREDGSIIVRNSTSPQLSASLRVTINFIANDSIHDQTHSCRGYAGSRLLEEDQFKPIVIVPDTVLSVTFSPEDGALVLGQQYSIVCIAAKTTGGLINLPSVEVFYSNGSLVSSANGITVNETSHGTLARMTTMSIASLRTSHAGTYTCRGSLQSPARSSPLVKSSAYNITLQLPTPITSSLVPFTTGARLPGSYTFLQCQVTLSSLIDTPVSVSFTWEKLNGNVLTANNRIAVSQVQVNSFTYQSTLNISGLSRALDSDSPITCSATVNSQIRSEYILPSNPITSGAHLVNVVGIHISISSIGSTNLLTGNGTYTLVCTVREEEDVDGTPTVNWIAPNGQIIQAAASSGDISVVKRVSGLVTTVSLQFNPLRTSHSGQYMCQAVLSAFEYTGSETFDLDVEVGNLHVVIQPSSTSYLVGSSLQLTCQVAGDQVQPIGTTNYTWTSTCTGECFVLGQATPSINRGALRAVDSGRHTCTITDSVGNSGSGSINIAVTGVGVFHSQLGLLQNNSVILRNQDNFGTFSCLSGSSTPNIGQWSAPNGQQLTQVYVGGVDDPGIVNLSLASFEHRPWQGVLSCVIPDERGTMQVLHIGVHNTSAPPAITSLTPFTLQPFPHRFTLNCVSSGSAASNITWMKSNVILTSSTGYEMVQILRDGTTSTYDNLLVVRTSNPNDIPGAYSCLVTNDFGQQRMDITLQGISVTGNEVFSLSSRASITCSSDLGVDSVQWLYNSQIVTSSTGSQAELTIDSVNDTLHNRRYTCQTMGAFGIQEHTINILVEVDAEQDLTIEITPSTTDPTPNQAFSLTCTATKAAGLQNTPTIEWINAFGNTVTSSESDGIIVRDTVTSGLTSSRTLKLLSFDSSTHVEFTCRTTTTSPAPPFTLTKRVLWEILTEPGTNPTTTTPEPIDADTSQCSEIFQLVLGKVNDCEDWAHQDAQEKQDNIMRKLTTEITKLCPQCLVDEYNFEEPEFSCPSNGLEEQKVLFRATISSGAQTICNKVLAAITEWVEGGEASLLVLTNRLAINSNCDVQISTINSPLECRPIESANPDENAGKSVNIALYGGAGAGVAILVVVILSIIVAVICCLRMHKKKSRNSMRFTDSTRGQALTSHNDAFVGNPGVFSPTLQSENTYYYDPNHRRGPMPLPSVQPQEATYEVPYKQHKDFFQNDEATVSSFLNRDSSSSLYIKMNPAGVESADAVDSAKLRSELYDDASSAKQSEGLYEKVGEDYWGSQSGKNPPAYYNFTRSGATEPNSEVEKN